jgi:hypothetical protein
MNKLIKILLHNHTTSDYGILNKTKTNGVSYNELSLYALGFYPSPESELFPRRIDRKKI